MTLIPPMATGIGHGWIASEDDCLCLISMGMAGACRRRPVLAGASRECSLISLDLDMWISLGSGGFLLDGKDVFLLQRWGNSLLWGRRQVASGHLDSLLCLRFLLRLSSVKSVVPGEVVPHPCPRCGSRQTTQGNEQWTGDTFGNTVQRFITAGDNPSAVVEEPCVTHLLQRQTECSLTTTARSTSRLSHVSSWAR